MKLDKKQFCTAVDTYKTMLEEENQIIDFLDISPNWKCSEWINNYYELLTDLCELEKDDLYGSDLDWFCFDTNFGKEKDLAVVEETASGRTWNIKDANMLYTMIMGFKE